MQTPPILILFFNRPSVLSALLKRVKEASPSAVYLASDGPRHDRDEAFVEQCRRMAVNAGWNCPVQTRFLDFNHGCGLACSRAIDWFFSNVAAGIVLEDDCHPDPTFFHFAAELLHKYAGTEQVYSISGSCLDVRTGPNARPFSYSFSLLPFCWGLAAWSRSWSRYRFHLNPATDCRISIDSTPSRTTSSVRGWRRRFRRASGPTPNTWAYQWTHLHLANGGLSVIPDRNLICNVTSPSNTNMTKIGIWQDLPTDPMTFPLRHPPKVGRDLDLDRHLELVAYNHRPWLTRKAWQFANRHRLIPLDLIRLGRWRRQ